MIPIRARFEAIPPPTCGRFGPGNLPRPHSGGDPLQTRKRIPYPGSSRPSWRPSIGVKLVTSAPPATARVSDPLAAFRASLRKFPRPSMPKPAPGARRPQGAGRPLRPARSRSLLAGVQDLGSTPGGGGPRGGCLFEGVAFGAELQGGAGEREDVGTLHSPQPGHRPVAHCLEQPQDARARRAVGGHVPAQRGVRRSLAGVPQGAGTRGAQDPAARAARGGRAVLLIRPTSPGTRTQRPPTSWACRWAR